MTTPLAWLKQRFEEVLVDYWRHHAPVTTPAWPFATAPAENLQSHMNLVMPLADTTAVGRATALNMIGSSVDELFTGLSSVGTVHFARFDLVGPNLCMYSVFDGDFANYIRDFIALFGTVFDVMMSIVADPAPTPVERNPEAFIDWIHAHDSFQIPYDVTSLFPEEKDMENLSRDVILLLDENANVQLGRYSGYPSISVAQIRLAMGLDW